jgi:hypothetical protein
MRTDDNRCRECGSNLSGKNAIDVGYCIPCYNMMMADPDDVVDDFQRCAECDGHDACSDFGCAMKSGLGHLLKYPL